MSLEYYDKTGKVISWEQYQELKADNVYSRVALTEVKDAADPLQTYTVSTVWTGQDLSGCWDPLHQALIFETAVFDLNNELKPDSITRQPTIERARAAHDAVVNLQAADMTTPEITQLWHDE